MIIKSGFEDDYRHSKTRPGGYEWWYFDLQQAGGPYSAVIIFYEGNPFSPRYMKTLANGNAAMASEHPAVSISVYEDGRTQYYSFTEYDSGDLQFDEKDDGFRLQIGGHVLIGAVADNTITYHIDIDETLPSGDRLQAGLTFESKVNGADLVEQPAPSDPGEHMWNLVQPRAEVTGFLVAKPAFRDATVEIESLRGVGYHDHNLGHEVLSKSFLGWHWGRFHFKAGTLVYYLMERQNSRQQYGWLIRPDNKRLKATFSEPAAEDHQLSLFGLKSARRVEVEEANLQIKIFQRKVVDNGPFYQRFLGEAVLHNQIYGEIETVKGFAEYIRPSRIHAGWIRMMVNMRLRYANQAPHWVQKSPRLYRWTW